MTIPPNATIISGQLIGRWIAELGDLIRSDREPEISPIRVGTWANLDDRDRSRLGEIGHDILWRLIEQDALATARVQQVSKVDRDWRGRRLGSPNYAAPDGAAPTCTCGVPTLLGTVHRIDGPCYVPDSSGLAPVVAAPGEVSIAGQRHAVDWAPSGETPPEVGSDDPQR